MLSIGSWLFKCSDAFVDDEGIKDKCCRTTTTLESIAGIVLVIIAALSLTGKMTPFCSTTGSYLMLGMGAFSVLPGVMLLGIISKYCVKESC